MHDWARTAVWLSLVLEAFFALFPLPVLGLLWPPVEAPCRHGFMQSPEWSASAMVLFGLTIVKLFRGVKRSGAGRGRASNADRVAALALFPLLGLVLSVVAVSRLIKEPTPLAITSQFVLLAAAIVVYFVFAGYAERQLHAS
jgi:hypothetical protein